MNKTVAVSIAGQNQVTEVSVQETSTAQEVLNAINCPDYELSPGVGQPPFGKDEKIFDRVKHQSKVLAAPRADAGAVR